MIIWIESYILFYIPIGDYVFIFGGEVNTSDRGHEGAGDFAADLISIHCSQASGYHLIPTQPIADSTIPIARGWTSMARLSDEMIEENENNTRNRSKRVVTSVLFGGLAGNDEEPIRLNDVWLLTISINV